MNREGWKPESIEYGAQFIQVMVPENCDILEMKHAPALSNPKEHIEHALSHLIAGPTLEAIVISLHKPMKDIQVAIAVSDNTRPVPYHGKKDDGILLPILSRLEKAGVEKRNIKIIVATGTHAATSWDWKRKAFGDRILESYKIRDHDCTSPDLCSLGSFMGIPVKINSHFYNADLRIVTGLVEPHFMAGFSGGRKAVCPGLVNLEVNRLFHSAEFMDNPRAANLVLEDNPCHEFALKVARKLGVHFSINVALNSDMHLAGVWAGELEKSHERAVETVRKWVEIEVDNEYDIVLTHGGRVAVNHYQSVKAACSVIPIIKPGGFAVLVAHNGDAEPVGKDNYRRVLQVLKDEGPGSFTDLLKSRRWNFVPDQWEVQKLDQFFKKVGSFDGLIYCSTNIGPDELKKLPGRSGYEFAGSDCTDIASMVQSAVDHAVNSSHAKEPRFAYVKDGPYAAPVFRKDVH